jgi:hypothetical protein
MSVVRMALTFDDLPPSEDEIEGPGIELSAGLEFPGVCDYTTPGGGGGVSEGQQAHIHPHYLRARLPSLQACFQERTSLPSQLPVRSRRAW